MKRFLAVALAVVVALGVFAPVALAATLAPSSEPTNAPTPPPAPVVKTYTCYTSSRTNTKAYAGTGKGAKVLKTYSTSGTMLTVVKVSDGWYKKTITVNGVNKTGYFKASELDFPKSGKAFKTTTIIPGKMKVYSSKSGSKLLKTYDRNVKKTLTPHTQEWYKVSLKVNKKTVTGYVKVADYKASVNKKTKWILIDQSSFKLYLYKGKKVIKKYPVTVGMEGHSTPNGIFSIVQKRPNPTWVNPAPNGWGSNMPATIGPGPNNPLGVRALNLSASGIRIHGSANPKNGTRSSHGCIRLTNKNIKDLYKRVSVGTVVKIQK